MQIDAYSIEKDMFDLYRLEYGEILPEEKLHSLMYLIQKESLSENMSLLFDEDFFVTEDGVKLLSVSDEYSNDTPFEKNAYIPDQADDIVCFVLDTYGGMSSEQLSGVVRRNFAWKNADCHEKISFSSMMIDATYSKAAKLTEYNEER